MDERELLNKIKENAEQDKVPKNLEPDIMENKLRMEKRKRRAKIYSMASAAASLALVFAIVWQVNRIGRNEEPVKKEISGTVAEESIKLDGFRVPDSDEDLFQTLKELETELGKSEYAVEETLDLATSRDMDAAAGTGTVKVEADQKSAEYSETNLQEQGVDEGDYVKTDGTYLYVLRKGENKVYIIKAQGGLEQIAVIQPDSLEETVREMYVSGVTLNLITENYETNLSGEEDSIYGVSTTSNTILYTYDISNRENPVKSGRVEQQGNYSTSRKNGDYMYLFTEYAPILREARDASTYIPQVSGNPLPIDDIFLPEEPEYSSYLVVSAIDLKKPGETADRKAIVSGAYLYYVSIENIYICSNEWSNNQNTTNILKLSYDEGKITPVGAGGVKGYVNDGFSLNEYDGNLRIVTTDSRNGDTENSLYVLDEKMNLIGRISGIAKGETIRSARFFGETGYFVTFKDTDPLFSVDLSDPKNPKILGELKVTGFSSYLHFYGENKLLGIGNEVDPNTGVYKGIKLSMFDISDPTNVTEADKYVIKDTYDCGALYDYKSVMINPEKNLVGFRCETDYLIFTYGEEGFENIFAQDISINEYGGYDDGLRGVYIGSTFYLVNVNEIKAYDMNKEFELLEKLEY